MASALSGSQQRDHVFATLLDPSAEEWRLSPSGGEFDSTRRYLDGSLGPGDVHRRVRRGPAPTFGAG